MDVLDVGVVDVVVDGVEGLVDEEPVEICAEQREQDLADEVASLRCAGHEQIQWIDSDELVGIGQLRGVEVGAGDEVGGEDGDRGQHLQHHQQHSEVDVFEVETLHPEEVKRNAEVHQPSYWNWENLDQQDEHPENEIQRQRRKRLDLGLEVMERESLLRLECGKDREGDYDNWQEDLLQWPDIEELQLRTIHAWRVATEVKGALGGKEGNAEPREARPKYLLGVEAAHNALPCRHSYLGCLIKVVRPCDGENDWQYEEEQRDAWVDGLRERCVGDDEGP